MLRIGMTAVMPGKVKSLGGEYLAHVGGIMGADVALEERKLIEI